MRKNAKGSGQGGREGREPGPTPRTRPRAPHKPHEVLCSTSCSAIISLSISSPQAPPAHTHASNNLEQDCHMWL